MEVARVTEEGLGLKFTNRTSQHLWNSVDRLRQDLRLGHDYFQVFQGAAIVNHVGKLLVVQRHGKWLFPGEYLTVGSHGRARSPTISPQNSASMTSSSKTRSASTARRAAAGVKTRPSASFTGSRRNPNASAARRFRVIAMRNG
jgi:hypothetical protein